jgi:hypothetical protein
MDSNANIERKVVVAEQYVQSNEELGLSRLGGDFELLRRVVGLFLDDYRQMLEKLRNAVAANDSS